MKRALVFNALARLGALFAAPLAVTRLDDDPGTERAPTPDMRGRTIADRFEVDDQVGAGGMSTVYRARDRATGQLVALKFLRSASQCHAVREAEALARLTHPGIVGFVDAGSYGPWGERYLAMEYLEGETLAQRLGRVGLTLGESRALARSLGAALAEAHRRDVVHRDLKPSNIFLPGGRVAEAKLIDFGVACARGHVSEDKPIGTPGYMAPEQGRSSAAAPSADVFSLGCVLYKCLTGQNAFRGSDPLAVMARILVEPAPRVRAVVPEISEQLDALVARMLSKDPEVRPVDGAAVVAALAEV